MYNNYVNSTCTYTYCSTCSIVRLITILHVHTHVHVHVNTIVHTCIICSVHVHTMIML